MYIFEGRIQCTKPLDMIAIKNFKIFNRAKNNLLDNNCWYENKNFKVFNIIKKNLLDNNWWYENKNFNLK